jgi:hypothetical protein
MSNWSCGWGTLWVKDISIEWIMKADPPGRRKGEKRKVEGIPLRDASQFLSINPVKWPV